MANRRIVWVSGFHISPVYGRESKFRGSLAVSRTASARLISCVRRDQTSRTEKEALVPVLADDRDGIRGGEAAVQFGEACGERLEEFPGMPVILG